MLLSFAGVGYLCAWQWDLLCNVGFLAFNETTFILGGGFHVQGVAFDLELKLRIFIDFIFAVDDNETNIYCKIGLIKVD